MSRQAGRRRVDDGANRWYVTGAGSGLGAALAAQVEDGLGAEVLRVDRAATASTEGRLRADLSTESGTRTAVDALTDWRPTVLVNCAGIVHSAPLAETPQELVDEILGVDLRAPVALMQAMGRLATPAEPVWVLNIVSPYRLVGIRNQSLYCATKAALSRAGEGLAVELADRVTVVSVVPGAFNTGIRPVQPHDAWLVRTYRNRMARTPEAVAADLLRRLRPGTRRSHWTLRVGWDGAGFEYLAGTLVSDWFLAGLDRLIGQRSPAGAGERSDR